MAVTFVISNLRKNVFGNLRAHTGTITLTGTPTSGGDTVTAATLGLHTITDLSVSAVVDSTTTPANAATVEYNAVPVQGLGGSTTGKLVFFGGAASAAPQAAITGSLTGYSGKFTAIGT